VDGDRAGLRRTCPNAHRLLTNLSFSAEDESRMMQPLLDHKDALESARQWLKDHPEDKARWLEGVTTFDGKPAADNLKLTSQLNPPNRSQPHGPRGLHDATTGTTMNHDVIITCALTGAGDTTAKSHLVPVTPNRSPKPPWKPPRPAPPWSTATSATRRPASSAATWRCTAK
jgi:hypothetical protein